MKFFVGQKIVKALIVEVCLVTMMSCHKKGGFAYRPFEKSKWLLNVRKNTQWVQAVPLEKAKKKETPFTIRFEQKITHPRLKEAIRILEIWKSEPRVAYKISFDRTSSLLDEIFYIP